MKQRFRTILFVGGTTRRRVLGFAILMHEPQIRFCYLDWIATATHKVSGGIGGALYERVRQESLALGSLGLFFECLPDDAALCPGVEMIRENRARLRFYERYGAVPVVGTAYETPVRPEKFRHFCKTKQKPNFMRKIEHIGLAVRSVILAKQ